MPQQLLIFAAWTGRWPLFFTAIVTALVLAFLYQGTALFRTRLIVAFAFTLLGMVAGYMSGLSRQPAVTAVVPAALSLIAGLSIYIVGAKRADQVLIALCVIGLCTNLLLGIVWGARARVASEDHYASAPRKLWEADVEAYVIQHRRKLGLQDYPPAPSKPKTDDKDEKD